MDSIFNHAFSRASRIRGSFSYTAEFNSAVSSFYDVHVGIFSSSYPLGFGYLLELSNDELNRLAIIYEFSIEQLDIQDRAFIFEYQARKYSASVDELVRTTQLEAKAVQLGTAEQRISTRISVMAADYERLNTVRRSVDLEVRQAENRVVQIRGRIDIERVNLAYADAEVSEKELKEAEANLRLLRSHQTTISIQMETARTALRLAENESRLSQLMASKAEMVTKTTMLDAQMVELLADRDEISARISNLAAEKIRAQAERKRAEYREAEVDTLITEYDADAGIAESEVGRIESQVKKADAETQILEVEKAKVTAEIATVQADVEQIRTKIANVDVQIAEAQLSAYELLSAEATTERERRLSTEYYPARSQIVEARVVAAGVERDAYRTLISGELAQRDARNAAVNAEYDLRINNTNLDARLDTARVEGHLNINEISRDAATSEAEGEIDVAEENVRVWLARISGSHEIKAGSIASASILSKANVTNKLIHRITGA